MNTKPLHLNDWQWFKLRLRVEAIDHRTPTFSYRFEFETPEYPESNMDSIIKCYVFYDPSEVRLEPTAGEDRSEIFLNWRNSAIHMIKEALSDTPELAAQLSIERQLKFVVLEGYGMGSKKVFERPGGEG